MQLRDGFNCRNGDMGSTGSIKANIQFLSYKMDKVDFSATQNLATLGAQDCSDFEAEYRFSFRNALRFVGQPQILYVTGVQAEVRIKSKISGAEMGKGIFIITGLFSADGVLTKQVEENLIKYQGPALLFPFLRANVSNLLSNFGFCCNPMPLINVNEAAKSLNLIIEERQLSN